MCEKIFFSLSGLDLQDNETFSTLLDDSDLARKASYLTNNIRSLQESFNVIEKVSIGVEPANEIIVCPRTYEELKLFSYIVVCLSYILLISNMNSHIVKLGLAPST